MGGSAQLLALHVVVPSADLEAEFKAAQEADPWLHPLRKLAQGSNAMYRMRDGLLFRIATKKGA